jgi:hypothetical protein
MTKDEIIRKIYGENPSFSYDTALPQQILDGIADDAVRDWPDDEQKAEYRRRVYERIRMGCVYAYDSPGRGQGMLPLTPDARHELQLSEYAGLIYVPVFRMDEL